MKAYLKIPTILVSESSGNPDVYCEEYYGKTVAVTSNEEELVIEFPNHLYLSAFVSILKERLRPFQCSRSKEYPDLYILEPKT